MIRKNSNVCIEIDGGHKLITGDVACQYTMKFESIIGFGIAEILESKEGVREGLNVLMAQFLGFGFYI